jgi:hypothetical protein
MGSILVKTTKEGYDAGGVVAAIVVCIIMIALIFGIMSGVVAIAMALWNGCLVALFPAISEITFWQMWGIYLLFDILLKPSIPSSNKE